MAWILHFHLGDERLSILIIKIYGEKKYLKKNIDDVAILES